MNPKDPSTSPSARDITLTDESLPSRLPIYATTKTLSERCDKTVLDSMDSTLLTLETSQES